METKTNAMLKAIYHILEKIFFLGGLGIKIWMKAKLKEGMIDMRDWDLTVELVNKSVDRVIDMSAQVEDMFKVK